MLYSLFRPLRRALFAMLFFTSIPAWAGAIFFSISVQGDRVVLTNLGNSSAFYPSVFRMVADGSWQALPTVAGSPPVTELPGNSQLQLLWPRLSSAQAAHPIAAIQPLMVRFFDQAGSGFGQISFLQQPMQTEAPLEAAYRGGQLHIQPDQTITRTWLLWAQEEGIAPLRGEVRFEHQQPAAQLIDWSANRAPRSFSLGAGQPAAMLLHETAQGFRLQVLPSGGLQGREQRSAWLDASPLFIKLAIALLLLAMTLLVWHWRQHPRKLDWPVAGD